MDANGSAKGAGASPSPSAHASKPAGAADLMAKFLAKKGRSSPSPALATPTPTPAPAPAPTAPAPSPAAAGTGDPDEHRKEAAARRGSKQSQPRPQSMSETQNLPFLRLHKSQGTDGGTRRLSKALPPELSAHTETDADGPDPGHHAATNGRDGDGADDGADDEYIDVGNAITQASEGGTPKASVPAGAAQLMAMFLKTPAHERSATPTSPATAAGGADADANVARVHDPELDDNDVHGTSTQSAERDSGNPMVEFAMKHFNVGGFDAEPALGTDKSGMAGFLARVRKGSLRGSIRRRQKVRNSMFDPNPASLAVTMEGAMGKAAEMCSYSASPTLPTSMLRMVNAENIKIAVSVFKQIHGLMSGSVEAEEANKHIQSIIAYCIERSELCDEVLCQLMRQVTKNPDDESRVRGWHLLALCTTCVGPTDTLCPYMTAFITPQQGDAAGGSVAAFALQALQAVQAHGQRRYPPSSIEMDAIRTDQPVLCRFYFLDGKSADLGVRPLQTVTDVMDAVAAEIKLKSAAGWGLYESTPKNEHYIRPAQYIGDVLSAWEFAKEDGGLREKAGGDAKFVFRKRLFVGPHVVSEDPVERGLVYAQVVHTVVRGDEFPAKEPVALQLAGLRAQVMWGDARPG